MLTENQKKILQLLIQRNPSPDYMDQLRASDDYAATEISTFISQRLPEIQGLVSYYQSEIDKLNEIITLLMGI